MRALVVGIEDIAAHEVQLIVDGKLLHRLLVPPRLVELQIGPVNRIKVAQVAVGGQRGQRRDAGRDDVVGNVARKRVVLHPVFQIGVRVGELDRDFTIVCIGEDVVALEHGVVHGVGVQFVRRVLRGHKRLIGRGPENAQGISPQIALPEVVGKDRTRALRNRRRGGGRFVRVLGAGEQRPGQQQRRQRTGGDPAHIRCFHTCKLLLPRRAAAHIGPVRRAAPVPKSVYCIL